MTAARLVARCVRGLEPALGTEILRTGSATVDWIGHREVGFRTGNRIGTGTGTGTGDDGRDSRGDAVRLRTADDVFLLARRQADVGPHKGDLVALAELARAVDLEGLARERRAHGGPAAGFGGIEISASFLGRRTYNRYDIEDAVGQVLAARAGVPYHARRHGEPAPPGHSGWRLTMDGTHATLLLRLGRRPAHRRAYKNTTVPGTLHPPVAAAMAQAAELRPGQRVLDPCCGAGTLLIEAHHMVPGTTLLGFDLDPAARRAARRNAGPLPVAVEHGDAGSLPVADRSIDRVLCNPPWGEQVDAGGRLAGHPERWWRELARVLTDEGRAIVLLPEASGLGHALTLGLTPVHVQQLSLFGSRPLLVRLERQRDRRRSRARQKAEVG
ncbi:methyltransferase domain-containing protein [Streptomyces cyaneochromogenes]|uniref:Methyltransferase domain-containing protein n=1 Tax=Streptomyces cyaneochromogenes TaxID=2496836 RepID=A0A3Q9ETB9_9ACTN|nr:methyltransferase domain-containing protein [Streptomyces cyaneochromogenes]AZQ35501.1 methyltransferase domain-containing protein [Streptomyces cyaneochromogenes]